MVRNVVRNSPPHLASLLIRLVQRHFRMNTARSNTPADQREKDLEAGLVAIGRPPTACAEQTNTGHKQHERPHRDQPARITGRWQRRLHRRRRCSRHRDSSSRHRDSSSCCSDRSRWWNLICNRERSYDIGCTCIVRVARSAGR